MDDSKIFTLEEARAMLPALRRLFQEANADLDGHLERIQSAASRYREWEERMATLKPDASSQKALEELRSCRKNFQDAINDLSREQNEFVDRLGVQVDKITSTGVLLRSLREGLIDFPAEVDGMPYFLCWRTDEDDITHWHLTSEGFIGRKPLALLSEYC